VPYIRSLSGHEYYNPSDKSKYARLYVTSSTTFPEGHSREEGDSRVSSTYGSVETIRSVRGKPPASSAGASSGSAQQSEEVDILISRFSATSMAKKAERKEVIFSFGSASSGIGARGANAIKRSILEGFKGTTKKLEMLKEEARKLMAALAKAQRDELLNMLHGGGGSRNIYANYIVDPPKITLDEMRLVQPRKDKLVKKRIAVNRANGKTYEGKFWVRADGRKRGYYVSPFSPRAPWGLDVLKGVFQKQRSGGKGYSNRGESIWDSLVAVDDDDKKKYSIRWADKYHSFIYTHFLLAGTSKMVGRPSVPKLLRAKLLRRYHSEVKKIIIALKKRYR
jgi:hypothetical protein